MNLKLKWHIRKKPNQDYYYYYHYYCFFFLQKELGFTKSYLQF